MKPIFVMKSSSPGSSLFFSDKTPGGYSVKVETPSLRAVRMVRLYDFESSDWLVAYFQKLSSYEKPWAGEEGWYSYDHEVDLAATCSALGHVEINIVLREVWTTSDCWSVKCTMSFDFGALSSFAKDAGLFFAR